MESILSHLQVSKSLFLFHNHFVPKLCSSISKIYKVLLDMRYIYQSKLLAYQSPKLDLECFSSTLIHGRHYAHANAMV